VCNQRLDPTETNSHQQQPRREPVQMAPGLCPRPNLCYARAPSPACALLDNHIEFRSWRENCNFEKSKELSRVRKMKSFGVDAEWIPGEERRHRLKMTAMKPSGNHTSVASVAGRHRRSAASVRAAGPRRWVGSRGGCALCGVRTGANGAVSSREGGGRDDGAHLRPCAGHAALVTG
jgi:hypothetical protein